MRKLLGVLLSVVILAGLASTVAITATRNWTLVQKPDGTTVFRENAGGNNNEVRVDRRFISLALSDIGQATTNFVVSPMTGYVSQIFMTAYGSAAINLSTQLRVLTGTTCAAGNGTLMTGGTLTFGSIGGSPAIGMVRSAAPTANNSVNSGTVICIGSDGGASNAVPAMATIVIDGNF